MTLRIKGAGILAGLALLGSMLDGGQKVQAGPIIPAITIKGKSGQVTGSDPYYYYDFQITLEAGFQWEPGDFILVNSIASVTPINITNSHLPIPGSTSTQPAPFVSPTICLLDSSPPYASSVKWENPTTSTISGGLNSLYVGDFIVVTSISVPDPVAWVTVDTQMHDSSGNTVTQDGIIVVFNASVPEPSSALLLLAGAAALPLLVLSQRRRKSKSQSQAA